MNNRMPTVVRSAAGGAPAPLAKIVRDLGPALLRVVAGRSDRPVESVTIHDPREPGSISPNGIVLGVGVADLSTATAALADLASAGAALCW
ncbi:hypothetical protein [Amycolatopsis pigmentata]|uniref:Uncharacterized protein n=1 Tax=Amycolatopsis pigmentata TaxID=450801 RepID=A0ABW5FKI0_9PSEU